MELQVEMVEPVAVLQDPRIQQLHLLELQIQVAVVAVQVLAELEPDHLRVAMVDLALSLFVMQTQLEQLRML